MPTMAGMLSSMGPTLPRCGSAPSATARSNAAAASLTRNAMAQTEGPCAWANFCPNEAGSALMTKLMSPWLCSVTFLLRWRATTGKPEAFEQTAQQLRVRGGVFDELESVGTHGIQS